jgi:hypothetical protein
MTVTTFYPITRVTSTSHTGSDLRNEGVIVPYKKKKKKALYTLGFTALTA